MRQIVECVAVFSESNRAEVVDALVQALRSEGPHVVSVNRDVDRGSVAVRIAGDPASVERAVVASVATAGDLIDLGARSESPPALGTTELIALIPRVGIDLEACVALARRLAERLGRELATPVFLSGAAASVDARRELADPVASSVAGLGALLAADPASAPDYGPAAPGPSGLTVVDVRPSRVRYTIHVATATNTLETGRAVASALDGGTGGLSGVRAEAAIPDGGPDTAADVTVTADILDLNATPLHRVFEMARVEARRHGASVRSTAVEGLLPQAALLDAAEWYLRLDGFETERVLESVLLEAAVEEDTEELMPRRFVDAVASDEPTPGGGSVAAVAGALGAALGGMVAALTVDRPRYAAVDAEMRELQTHARRLQGVMMDLAGADSAAFEAVMAAYRLPRGTIDETDERREAIQVSLRQATQVPLEIMARAVEVMQVARKAAETGNVNAVSDAGVAGFMGHAAVQSASLNVATNVMGLRDLQEGDRYRRRSSELLLEAHTLADEIDRLVRERIKG